MEQLFSLEYLVSILLSGISLGGQLALIAIGYTMVYGILRLINFAHGDVFMVAGLLGIYISAVMPIYAAIPVVIILTVALGFFIERAAYKPLRNAPRMSVMISAIGVSYLLQNTATYVTGGQPMTYPTIGILNKTVDIVGTSTKLVVIITPILVLVLIVLLTQLINHTKIGMAMRAVSAGAMPGLKAFVAAVFGGIGSIPGAVIGAFLIGICETIIKGLPSAWNVSVFSDAFTFALLIIILTCKPTGLFGEKATDKV